MKGKITKKFKGWFSISLKAIDRADNYSNEQYGISRTGAGKEIDGNKVEYNVARHTLSNDALVGLEELLLSKKEPQVLSSDLVEKIKNSDGKDIKGVDQLIKDAQKELNFDDKKVNDDAKKLYALSQVAKSMGAEFEVRDVAGHRKELVIYIDPNCEDPEKTISLAMRGLGINNSKLIEDAINRFNRQERSREPHTTVTHHDSTDEGYESGKEDEKENKEVSNDDEKATLKKSSEATGRGEGFSESSQTKLDLGDEILSGLSGVEQGSSSSAKITPKNQEPEQKVQSR